MDSEKIAELIDELKSKIKKGDVYYANQGIKNSFSKLMKSAEDIFPEKKLKIQELKTNVLSRNHGPYGSDILAACNELVILMEKKKEKDIKEKKAFLNSKDLFEKAKIVFRNGDEAYSITLCDSAVETFLKEHFDVPSTIIGAGSVKFLSECMILNIPRGLNMYLKEVKNKVSQMSNQIKHKSYVPNRLDAINALKATEELFVRKSWFENLTFEEKRKVQAGIGLK